MTSLLPPAAPAQPHFEPAPAQPTLRAGEVHLWRARLADAPADARSLLSPDEWLRASRFHFEPDRERFIAARALVRTILARYAGDEPRALRFETGPHGKPALAGSGLRFNLSHSGDLLLLAICWGREVGVDVEEMRDSIPFEMLADDFFEPEEAWSLRVLPAPERAWRFYDLWTSAEARLKASGLGLSAGLHVVTPDRWALCSLRPAAGYAGALAVEGGGFQLECWAWQK